MFFKKKLERIKLFVIGFLGSTFARILFSTVIIEERPSDYPKKFKRQGRNVIFAYWHSFMLAPGYATRNLGIKVLISRHTDGDYIAQIAQQLGFSPVRGSTTRGGMNALLNMIKENKRGTSFIITPDGPRGPRFVVQPGIVFLGQKTSYPIFPVSLGLTNYWELPSWDRFRIPKPFSRAIVIYGDPIEIPPKLDKADIERYRLLLEKKLNEMTVEAECLVGDM
ncbi:MAG: lysophospholipid acyltransferase family protein [Candidatus Scalinduaceae bacterium]